jgi:Gram-negative bacterial TonB protein C-terminal
MAKLPAGNLWAITVLCQESEVLTYCASRLTKMVIPAFAVALVTLSALNLPAQEGRKLISRPAPVYPEMARKFALTDVVKVQVVIAADGHIKETKFIGGHPVLVATVEDTLKKWKYAATSSDSTDLLEFDFSPLAIGSGRTDD